MKPIPGNDDWFVFDELPSPLRGVPGVQWTSSDPKTAKPLVHVSHLPLLKVSPPPLALPKKTPKPPKGIIPRPWQSQAVNWILGRRSGMLCDQMRLGKTNSALLAAQKLGMMPFIVAPLATIDVWKDWVGRVFKEPLVCFEGTTFDGSEMSRALKKRVPIFIHHEIVKDWAASPARGQIEFAIFDEAHLFAGKATKRTASVRVIAASAKRRLLLTGTPLWNEPAHLWPIFSICAPGAFGNYSEFVVRYASGKPGAHGLEAGGWSNTDELTQRLSVLLLRRTWRDLYANGTPPPSVERTTSIVPVDEDQRFDLELAAQAALSGVNASTIGAMATLRRQLSKVKIPAALLEVEKAVSESESVVVWTWHVETAREIHRLLKLGGYSVFLWTGKESQEERSAARTAATLFTPSVLVCTMSSAMVGIDFSFASRVVFVEFDYTPAIVGQAEMRTYSPVRDRPMKVVYLAAEHEMDRKLVVALVEKIELGAQVGLPASEIPLTTLRGW